MSALRGIGDFKPGMIVQSGTVVLNIVLAPTLMFGWGTGIRMGVAGHGAASFIAVVFGVAALLWYVVRRPGYLELRAAKGGCGWRCGGACSRLVLARGAEFALMGAYMFAVYAITPGGFGAAAQAGFGIGCRYPGGLHAGARARLLGQPGRRAELRRAPARSRARDVRRRR